MGVVMAVWRGLFFALPLLGLIGCHLLLPFGGSVPDGAGHDRDGRSDGGDGSDRRATEVRIGPPVDGLERSSPVRDLSVEDRSPGRDTASGWSVSTVAGPALLHFPEGVAVDDAGVVYVADTLNHVIRRIAGGVPTTIAGIVGTSGDTNGSANQATFNEPAHLVLGLGGALIIADRHTHRIRSLENDQVATVAGNGQSTFANGTALQASFNQPSGVAVDASGAIFVADTNNHRIRKISGGQVTNAAGAGTCGSQDGLANTATFCFPAAVAVAPNGALIIADAHFSTIRSLAGNQVTTLAGIAGEATHRDGPALQARFRFPRGVVVDAQGDIFVADTGNNRIRKISNGNVSTIAGNGQGTFADGLAAQASFFFPSRIALGAAGAIYVADTNNHRIRLLQP